MTIAQALARPVGRRNRAGAATFRPYRPLRPPDSRRPAAQVLQTKRNHLAHGAERLRVAHFAAGSHVRSQPTRRRSVGFDLIAGRTQSSVRATLPCCPPAWPCHASWYMLLVTVA